MGRTIIYLLLALALGGCASGMRDSMGRLYPEQCRGPMVCDSGSCKLASATVEVKSTPLAKMPLASNGKPNLGYYYFGSGSVIIADTLSGARRDDVIRHEMCHAIAGDWHM